MKSRLLAITLMLSCFGADPVVADDDPRRFENEIRLFERRDQTNPPLAGPVLFTGSSSIVKWQSLSNDFAGQYVLNRGFGGSTWRDLNFYFARLVPKYRPRAVVVYEGDNDLAAGRSVKECLADFDEFRAHMRATLPGLPVAILSTKHSPVRQHLFALQNELNEGIRRRLLTEPNWIELDVASPLLDTAGAPRAELFEADQLHLNRAGYAVWAPVVRLWVEKFGGP